MKIDPWGIAFENFDAVGKWRDSIGKNPVDSTSKLYNKHELRGIDGLKDYLMDNRQDQFARALCYKMASYALGRPLTFGDRSLVEKISSQLREDGDGLADLVFLIVQSDLFQLKQGNRINDHENIFTGSSKISPWFWRGLGPALV